MQVAVMMKWSFEECRLSVDIGLILCIPKNGHSEKCESQKRKASDLFKDQRRPKNEK
jgi:hypothetical protein